MAEALTFQDQTNDLRRKAMVAGCGALGLCLLGALVSGSPQFFRSYLVAVMYWFGIPLGSMAVLMIQHLVHGAWGHAVRRILEASTRTIPVMIVLWVPLMFGLKHLYIWSVPEVMHADHHLAQKAVYLNPMGFGMRACIYFVVWWTLARAFNRRSEEQDRTGDPAIYERFGGMAAVGLVVFGFTVSFAAFDWMMSLEPKWYSTIYGALTAIGWILASIAFTMLIAYRFREEPALKEAAPPQVFHDIGNLMMAFLMLWTYMAFSQFLLIWSANLPEETEYFLKRLHGGWAYISIGLPLLHFVLPFMLLIMRPIKRNPALLAPVAAWLLAMRYVDHFWLIVPAFHPEAFHLHWMDIVAPIGVGGIWLWSFFTQLPKLPLVPMHDEGTEEDDEDEPTTERGRDLVHG